MFRRCCRRWWGAGSAIRKRPRTDANSAADALMRLEDLCMEARATPPKRLIASAVDIIVFIARREGGRVITEILEADDVRGEGA
ncbi:MAG: hypothetical protein IPL62_20645 [Caulobacteraceae bacterium]|nr:hypothetical protein [Caulobacteraceae bacterium]